MGVKLDAPTEGDSHRKTDILCFCFDGRMNIYPCDLALLKYIMSLGFFLYIGHATEDVFYI